MLSPSVADSIVKTWHSRAALSSVALFLSTMLIQIYRKEVKAFILHQYHGLLPFQFFCRTYQRGTSCAPDSELRASKLDNLESPVQWNNFTEEDLANAFKVALLATKCNAKPSMSAKQEESNTNSIGTSFVLSTAMKSMLLSNIGTSNTEENDDEADYPFQSIISCNNQTVSPGVRQEESGNKPVSRNCESSRYYLKGVPKKRPLYKEVARRAYFLCRFEATQKLCRPQASQSSAVTCQADSMQRSTKNYFDARLLIDASHFGFVEHTTKDQLRVLPSFYSTISNMTSENAEKGMIRVVNWLMNLGDNGISEILGMRQTVGSIPYAIAPTSKDLLEAARQPHPKAKPKPSSRSRVEPITVATRARAKHAHRASGEMESYFGTIKGGSTIQNLESERIVAQMIHDAVWINIHTFTGEGTDRTSNMETHDKSNALSNNDVPAIPSKPKMNVIELRVKEGYGARWSADWIPLYHDQSFNGEHKMEHKAHNHHSNSPLDFAEPLVATNITFRGFLEPHMVDGHERKWRH